MKKLLSLLLFTSVISFAQISKVDFDKQTKLIMGNDPQAALVSLENFEKKFPADAQVMCLRGLYQFRDSNPNGALVTFSNAIKTNPKYAFSYACRAQVFAQKELMDKAIADISQAIALEPKNIDFLLSRVDFYWKTNQYDLGLMDSKLILKLAPNEINRYVDVVNMTKKAGQNTNVDIVFEQAYANKNIPKYEVDLAFARFFLGENRFSDAKIKFDAALATNEKEFTAQNFNDASVVEYKLKNLDRSILFCEKAIALEPTNIDYRNNLCGILIDQKKWQKLKENAEVSIRNGTDSPMAHMYYAIGLKYTGFESLALEYEKKAKQLEAEQNK